MVMRVKKGKPVKFKKTIIAPNIKGNKNTTIIKLSKTEKENGKKNRNGNGMKSKVKKTGRKRK